MGESADLYLGHDLGTGGDKAALVNRHGELLASAFTPYALSHRAPELAEQDPDDYWQAIGETTRSVLERAGVVPERVAAVGFAGQMLTIVPVDAACVPTRPAITWLDSRADDEARRLIRRLGGARVIMAVAGAVPSGKDVICKMAWLRRNEPEVFSRTAAFLDATGYLVARATGELVSDQTAAGATGLLNRKTRRWDRLLTTVVRAPLSKLPEIRACADVVGGLTSAAAADLGLVAGTPVVAGLGDALAAQVGAGAVSVGDVHLCIGTSGWVCVTTAHPKDIGRHGVFALPAADPECFATVGAMETAGECLDWFVDNLGGGAGHQELVAEAAEVEPGSEGLLFLPWMFGERSPFTDTLARGGFVNLSLHHGRGHLVRAILEGVAHNLHWILEVLEEAGHGCDSIRAIGGGSRSDVWLQIVADVMGREVIGVANAPDAGAIGAALTAAVGCGAIDGYPAIASLVSTDRCFRPDPARHARYEPSAAAFRALRPVASSLGRNLARRSW